MIRKLIVVLLLSTIFAGLFSCLNRVVELNDDPLQRGIYDENFHDEKATLEIGVDLSNFLLIGCKRTKSVGLSVSRHSW